MGYKHHLQSKPVDMDQRENVKSLKCNFIQANTLRQ